MNWLPLLILSLMCSACGTFARGRASASPAAPLRLQLSFTTPADIRLGCRPSAGDSTTFTLDVIVDSLSRRGGAGLDIVRAHRPAPSTAYSYRNVTIEIQRAGDRRVAGLPCPQDAGLVVRGTEAALDGVQIRLDRSALLRVQVWDDRGRRIAEVIESRRQVITERATWNSRG